MTLKVTQGHQNCRYSRGHVPCQTRASSPHRTDAGRVAYKAACRSTNQINNARRDFVGSKLAEAVPAPTVVLAGESPTICFTVFAIRRPILAPKPTVPSRFVSSSAIKSATLPRSFHSNCRAVGLRRCFLRRRVLR